MCTGVRHRGVITRAVGGASTHGGEFLLICIWAVRLTACFVYRARPSSTVRAPGRIHRSLCPSRRSARGSIRVTRVNRRRRWKPPGACQTRNIRKANRMTFETSQTSPGVPRSYAGSTARRMGTGACGNAPGTRARTARWAASRTKTCTSVSPSREKRYVYFYFSSYGQLE